MAGNAGSVAPVFHAEGYVATNIYDFYHAIIHNNKLYFCRQDGTIGHEPSGATDEYWFLSLDGNFGDAAKLGGESATQWQTKIDVEKARIDALIALEESSEPTDVEKEVNDIKVGADGVTYGSAGTAVREQIASVKSDLSEEVTNRNSAIVEAISEEQTARSQAIYEVVNEEKERAEARENEIEALFTAPTEEAVNKWLDEHPEATTTVQDESLVSEKMHESFWNDKRIKKEYVTPQMFGAKANWESNKASKFYSSLAELKVVYPMAQSLDDEIDLLATEYALANYRNVVLPIGGYYFNRTVTLSVGQTVVGMGTANTQITYTGESEPVFVVNDNVTMKDFKITHKATLNVVGSESTVTAIHANGTNRSIYEGLQIVGFNYGIYFYQNSWCNYVNNCSFNYCNYGIYGENEFNEVIISQGAFTYNNIGIMAGHGRSLIIENCTLERNNYGVRKSNQGDITIKGCYFELHNNRSVDVIHSTYPVELATISNCSFYTNTDSEVFIGTNGNGKTTINIFNNIFECNVNSLNGNTIKCVKSASNAIQFNIENNFLKDGCEIGIEHQHLNGYTNNGRNVVVVGSSNLSQAFNNGVMSVRFEFVSSGTITLPDLSNVGDGQEVRKFVAYWTGSSDYTDESRMTIDTTNKSVIGEKAIRPNTVYSIYYQDSKYFIFK